MNAMSDDPNSFLTKLITIYIYKWTGNMYGNLIHLLNNHTKSEQ